MEPVAPPRTRLARSALLCLGAAVFAAGSYRAAAQDAVFRVDVDMVRVPIQVTNPQGSLVRDLEPRELEIVDNGVARPVEHVWLDTDLPLTLGIVLDVSESQQSRVEEQQRAIATFFRGVLRPDDRAFVVSVGEDVMLVSDLTDSPLKLLRAVESVNSAKPVGVPLGEQCPKRTLSMPGPESRSLVIAECGGTALWNAIWASATAKLQEVSGRKALIVLSDGVDTGSKRTFKETLAAVHRAEIVLYAIRYPRHPRARATFGLQRLAEETGGLQFLTAESVYDQMFQRIAEDLRNQYVIGFKPEGGAGFHTLEVRVKRENVQVRARSGYVR